MKNFDLILFHATSGIFARGIEYFTNSPWDHVGLILVDPTWLHPSLHGTFILETVWGTGVRITPLWDRIKNYEGTIYTREYKDKEFNIRDIKPIYDLVHDKPYDVVLTDWLCAYMGWDIVETDKRFWCSALVGYILIKMNLMKITECDWTTLKPCDFDKGGKIDGWVKYDKLKRIH